MATTSLRQEGILARPKEERESIWERLRKFMDTVAIELSPFFGPVFSSNPSKEYLKKADVREKTFVDSELRNK